MLPSGLGVPLALPTESTSQLGLGGGPLLESSPSHQLSVSPTSPSVLARPASPKTIDLTNVPPEDRDLTQPFSKEDPLTLSTNHPYDCAVDLLPGTTLPKSRLYNLFGPEQQSMEKSIWDYLAAGIIRSSCSPVWAVFFFVVKKDGTLQPCFDFHELNAITVQNTYPLPLITSTFNSLHQATVFSKLDLCNTNSLVRIRKGDVWKETVNTSFVHFERLSKLFGPTNAPPVFQNLINYVLQDMINTFFLLFFCLFRQCYSLFLWSHMSSKSGALAAELSVCKSREVWVSLYRSVISSLHSLHRSDYYGSVKGVSNNKLASARNPKKIAMHPQIWGI